MTTVTRGMVLLLVGAVTGCALFSTSGRIIHQQGRTTIQLERDPSATGVAASRGNAHPASITPAQVAALLRGVQIRSEQGLVGTILSLAAPAETVFLDEEVTALAPLLADGLAQAAPLERVGFTYWSAQPGRRNGPLSGYLAVREPYLRVGVNEHPTVGWQDPQDPSASPLYELEFAHQSLLAPGTEDERKAGRNRRPLLQINYRQYLAATPRPITPAVSASRPVPQPSSQPEARPSENQALKELQQAIKALTASNQELRARLTDALAQQDQIQAEQDQIQTLQALYEELTRLRRELAETRQLLADKTLELHRLQGRSKEIK